MAILKWWNGSAWVDVANTDAIPKVPSTDEAMVRFDGTGGLVQDTPGVTSDGSGNLHIAGDIDCGDLDVGGAITVGDGVSVAQALYESYWPWKSNKWFSQSPGLDTDVTAAGFTLVTDEVWYIPLFISHRVTFDGFGFHVVTAEGGKNARVAIYNSSAAAPSTLVVESANMTLAGTGAVTIAVTQTTLQAGPYFWAVNTDASTATVRRLVVLNTTVLSILGSAAPGDDPANYYKEASAFGAFPATATPGTEALAGNLPVFKLQVV